MCHNFNVAQAVADPGFPLGGVDLVGGGVCVWTPEMCHNFNVAQVVADPGFPVGGAWTSWGVFQARPL